jgi:enoyl-CoA hydratase
MGLVKELAYTGRRLSAENALKHGLVTQVFETQEAMVAGALACAKEMANKPPVAIWGTKQALNYARDHSVEDSLRQMGWLQGAIWSNPHIHEAIAAAKEKRPAQFPPLAPLKGFKTLG